MTHDRRQTTGCPVCSAKVAPPGPGSAYPFCSERCRTIDLGRWLDERYRVPLAEQPSDDDTPDSD